MKLLLTLCLCLFAAACGTTEEEIAAPVPAPVASMRSVQTTATKPAPQPEQPQKKPTRKRLELTVGSDWIVRGTGTYRSDTLTSLPGLASCQEYVNAHGGGKPPADYPYDLAARLEQSVTIPADALAAEDLSLVPLVQYTRTLGLPVTFVGQDNAHCTEQPITVSEFRFEAQGSPWQPTYTEYAGASSNPPKGATALRLRLRLHGQSTITPVSVKVLVLYTVWE